MNWEEILEELYDLAECDICGYHQYELGRVLFDSKDETKRQEGADWIKTAAESGCKLAIEFAQLPCFESYA